MVAKVVTLPAPSGGWNARDSIADMPPDDAVSLTNWFPRTTECQLRQGYTNYSTGLPGQVNTVFSYSGGSTYKLFAASVTGIYDCTAGGAVGSAVVSGLTNDKFQYVNFATAGGNFMLSVNGADKMRYYDGTTWSADGGTFTVTGVDTATWLSICAHKQRVWAIQKGTLKAWYLPPSSIAGAASLQDMSPFFRMGGTLAGLETWTIDGGEGVDDYLVFISTNGEVLVYKGTDPSSVSTWQMQGLYRIGSPIGNRCLYKYQGDVLAITQDGVVPLSTALQSERVNPSVAVSNKIQSAMSDAVTSYGSSFGWQLLNFPQQNQLILNVPIAVGSQQQYVMNTINQSWCNYTGWSANCWELWQNNAYFGGNTVVCQAWSGFSDGGNNIQASGLQAFNTFGTPDQKRFLMARPFFRSNGTPSVQVGFQLDYDITDNSAPLNFSPPPGGALVWGSGLWGTGLWGSSTLTIRKDWQGISGVASAGAPRVKTASQGIDLRWVSTVITMEAGAPL